MTMTIDKKCPVSRELDSSIMSTSMHCRLHPNLRGLHPNLRGQCLLEVGIVVDESTRSEGLRKYDSWFQLAFRSGEVWELQDRIFSMWERKEVKGQRSKKENLDPQVEMKSKS